jgi:hypothetical protein
MKTSPVKTLLLAAALTLQPLASAGKAKIPPGTGYLAGAAAPSQEAAPTPTGSVFVYECDDACLLPGAPVPAGKYAVVSPVGKQTTKTITQGPRLDTLHGKTIAVVGGSFMASITHPEIKRLIMANYPTAKVILLNEIGSAGPFPGPGVTRQSKDEFQKKLMTPSSLPGRCSLSFPAVPGFVAGCRQASCRLA